MNTMLQDIAIDPDLDEPRPAVAHIDLDALIFNLRSIKKVAAPARVMAIVKANAYGHGLIECSRRLTEEGVDFLGVAFAEEGVVLRKAGIDVPVLVMGAIAVEQVPLFLRYGLQVTASSTAKLHALDQAATRLGLLARVHLKIDTGMERVGVRASAATDFFAAALKCKHCEIVGVYSHLADLKESDRSFTNYQLERFQDAITFFEKRTDTRPLRHIASSGAITIPEARFDMVRSGIALYGVPAYPSQTQSLLLKPVMRLVAKVAYSKVVPEGTGVSYGLTWRAPHDTRVVTIPLGYGDGYLRGLSNRGEVLIRGKRYPIVGVVCMDQFMVAVGADDVEEGEEVVLLGKQGREEITVNELAAKAQSVPHEVMCAVRSRVPRRY